jgi:hypothetical protein
MLTYALRGDIFLFDKVYEYRNYFVSILYGIFLVIYLIVFWMLLRQLKKNFPLYFSINRSRLYWLSSIIVCGLIVHIVFR